MTVIEYFVFHNMFNLYFIFIQIKKKKRGGRVKMWSHATLTMLIYK